MRVIKDEKGNVMISLQAVLKRWKKYFEKLINKENDRDPRTEETRFTKRHIVSVEKKLRMH